MNKLNVNKRDITFFIIGMLSTLLLTWFVQKKKPKDFPEEGKNAS